LADCKGPGNEDRVVIWKVEVSDTMTSRQRVVKMIPRNNCRIDMRVYTLRATMTVASDGHRMIDPRAVGWSVLTMLQRPNTEKDAGSSAPPDLNAKDGRGR
jgi:hypothetical protein